MPQHPLEQVFAALPALYLVVNAEDRIVAASDAYLAATLTRRDAIVGRNLFDVFPDNPDDRESESGRNMRASLDYVRRTAQPDTMPLARHDVRRPPPGDGFEEKYWSPVNSPVLDEQGRVAFVLHRVEDVTEVVRRREPPTGEPSAGGGPSTPGELEAEVLRNRQEVAALHTRLLEATAQLEQSERTMRAFLEFAPPVMTARDREGRLLLRSRSFEDGFFRHSDDEAPGGSGQLPEELTARMTGLERRVLEEGVAISGEAEVPRSGGPSTVFEFTKFPLRDESGEVYAVGTIATDVTSDRAARRELEASESTLRQIADNLDEVFLLWEEDGLNMLYVSSALERVTGLTAEQFLDPVGRLEFVHPDDRHIVEAPPAAHKEFRLLRAGGGVRWIRSRTTPVSTAGPGPQRFVTTLADVTEQTIATLMATIARREAEAANRTKSEFLSRMSHELRTPLNAILGFGQLLGLDDLTSRQRDAVSHIVGAGRHLLALVDEVLDITRVETGDLRLSAEPVPVAVIVAEATGMVRQMAEQRGISIEIQAGLDGLHVSADHQRLRQVLVNLLSNAVKYNREGGRVVVRAAHTPGGVRLAVEDTGAGIDPDAAAKLFHPFERLGAEGSGVEGTGLGLAHSKHLVEAMGGDIGVDRPRAGGSEFWVELPMSPPPEGDAAVARPDLPAAPPTAAGTAVLYVEDNISNVRLVERLLERRPSVRLVAAMEGRRALDLAVELRPALVLLDLHLPDMRGEDVLVALRNDPRTAEVPIVVLSADATADLPRRLLGLGASEYLTKPLDLRGLLEVVDRATSGDGPSPVLPVELVVQPAAKPAPAQRDPQADRPTLRAPAADPRLGMVVHDLNNHLGVILNYCDLLRRQHEGTPLADDLDAIALSARVAAEAATALVVPAGDTEPPG